MKFDKQKSEAWLKKRSTRISASDGGVVLDQDHYRRQFTFIIDKVRGKLFEPNENCYHGNKYEDIAKDFLQY